MQHEEGIVIHNKPASLKYSPFGLHLDKHVPGSHPAMTIPKIGGFIEMEAESTKVEFREIQLEAKGSSAAARAEVSALGASAMVRGELASASASIGPVGVKVGLGVDTGASIGVEGIEAKVLGTGFSIGPKTSISVLGSEASCSVM